MVEKLAKFGAEVMSATPEQFEELIKEQISANAIIVKEAGITAN